MRLAKRVSEGWVIRFSCWETTDRKLTIDLLSRKFSIGDDHPVYWIAGCQICCTCNCKEKEKGLKDNKFDRVSEGVAVAWEFKVSFSKVENGAWVQGWQYCDGVFLFVSVCVCVWKGFKFLCVKGGSKIFETTDIFLFTHFFKFNWM